MEFAEPVPCKKRYDSRNFSNDEVGMAVVMVSFWKILESRASTSATLGSSCLTSRRSQSMPSCWTSIWMMPVVAAEDVGSYVIVFDPTLTPLLNSFTFAVPALWPVHRPHGIRYKYMYGVVNEPAQDANHKNTKKNLSLTVFRKNTHLLFRL